jgi:hypothetical protein
MTPTSASEKRSPASHGVLTSLRLHIGEKAIVDAQRRLRLGILDPGFNPLAAACAFGWRRVVDPSVDRCRSDPSTREAGAPGTRKLAAPIENQNQPHRDPDESRPSRAARFLRRLDLDDHRMR